MRPRGALSLLALLGACSTAPPTGQAAPTSAAERSARGARRALVDAQLFVPSDFSPSADGVVPLAVHFQGGLATAEDNFARMRRPGVLITSKLTGRSGAFAAPFRDPRAFGNLLRSGERALSEQFGRALRFGPVLVTSFSAGYGAVRELLKHPAHYARIEALVMADSMYASVVAPDVRAPRAEQMIDFSRFAQAAARGEKVFVLTHTRIATEYASTAECADWLLAAVAGARAPSDAVTERGVPVAAEFHRRGLHVYAFEGDDAQAHVDCLTMIPELVRRHAQPAPR